MEFVLNKNILIMDVNCDIKLLLITVFILGIYAEAIPNRQSNYLDSFRFIPILGDCYQLYSDADSELISSCRREPDLINQACIHWVSGHECTGLVTPTNETITLRCIRNIRFDQCFEVYDINNNLTVVCQEIFQGHAVGIKTPDGFTIIFHDSLCRSATGIMERLVYADFVDNFSLDVEARSCYKVYGSEKVVTPYNCLSKAIHDSCVFNMMEGCTALTTQNNEVLVLDCTDKSQNPTQRKCFNLYTPDNQVHTVCQKKVEERCVGVVTPSNLTVLFECFFCSKFMNYVYYNRERQRTYRQFVKSYLEDEYLGKNSHAELQYEVFSPLSSDNVNVYSEWIQNTSCLSITLESKETIILECLVTKEKQEQPGCFQLITTGNETQSSCIKILNEACVGLTTPMNLSVVLSCYNLAKKYKMENERPDWYFILNGLKDFVASRHTFQVGNSYLAYRDNGNNKEQIAVHVQKIDKRPNCTGILIETEMIVLSCTDGTVQQNGCYDAVKLNSTEQVQNMCVKILQMFDLQCIGILTSSNWIVSFSCNPYISYYVSGESAMDEKSWQVDFISGTIPSKLPKRERRGLQWKPMGALTLKNKKQIKLLFS